MFELAIIVIAVALLPAAVAVVIYVGILAVPVVLIVVVIALLAYEPRLAIVAGIGSIGWFAAHAWAHWSEWKTRWQARKTQQEARRLAALPPFHLEGSGEYDFTAVYGCERKVLATICPRDEYERRVVAALVHEDDNVSTVRVDVAGQAVGYLTPPSARRYREWLAARGHAGRTATCAAMVTLARYDPDDFGIKLDLPSLYS